MLVWRSITNPYSKAQQDVGVLSQVTGTGSLPCREQHSLGMDRAVI